MVCGIQVIVAILKLLLAREGSKQKIKIGNSQSLKFWTYKRYHLVLWFILFRARPKTIIVKILPVGKIPGFYFTWVNFTEAADFCNKQNKNGGSQLVIADETEFAWVLPRLYGDSWLDMTMTSPGVPPKQWNDGTSVSFTNWKDGCPYRNDWKFEPIFHFLK